MASIRTWQRRLSPLLMPLGALYSLLMARRRAAYARGARPRFIPAAPCVSVGNIGWGGTGKTPVVSWLLDWAARRGTRAVVLTRGYGGTPPELPFLVTPAATPAQAGDEPLMLARAHPQAVIVADPTRRRSGPWAQARYAPGLFVLDDGFQHLAVARHIDLVLLRPGDLDADWNRVIPAGSWREGSATLAKAHAFLIKTPDGSLDTLAPAIHSRLARLGKPVFGFALRPTGVLRLADNTRLPDLPDFSDAGASAPYVLVTGIGEPDQAAATATAFLGRAPVRHLIYPDHHAYTARDWADMAAAARAAGATLLCTPKDAAKLAPLADHTLHTLVLETTFGAHLFCDTDFAAWWEAAFAAVA
ncbi:MAG: tetraacyldisaccharide 4'-kinase [Desulfovibrionaceae bacterium]